MKTQNKPDLKELAAYAKRHGYTVEIKSDHIVAANNVGAIRTGSMETLKKVAGGWKVTTEEAGKKACPFIQNGAIVMFRLPPTSLEDIGRSMSENAPANIRCIAERCMAWHWHCKFENDTLEFSAADGYCRLIHEGES